MTCIDHLDFTNGTCPDCKLSVDAYGNTENSFEFCAFPDCGCDGARLCMATKGASDNASKGNVEGMWSRGSDPVARKAAFFTIGLCQERKGK